jgi:uncharacterized protein YdeI (YjbR/CyaY-like superfamily)
MEITRTDLGWLVTSTISLIGLILAILKWDFSGINPINHIKAIYILLLLIGYGFAAYAVLSFKKKEKRKK